MMTGLTSLLSQPLELELEDRLRICRVRMLRAPGVLLVVEVAEGVEVTTLGFLIMTVSGEFVRFEEDLLGTPLT